MPHNLILVCADQIDLNVPFASLNNVTHEQTAHTELLCALITSNNNVLGYKYIPLYKTP